MAFPKQTLNNLLKDLNALKEYLTLRITNPDINMDVELLSRLAKNIKKFSKAVGLENEFEKQYLAIDLDELSIIEKRSRELLAMDEDEPNDLRIIESLLEALEGSIISIASTLAGGDSSEHVAGGGAAADETNDNDGSMRPGSR